MERLERARREFAEKIRTTSALRSTRLVDALGTVPREEFVGPGPWQILRLADAERGYEVTPDADPQHLYDNVLVALDASRNLNNGEPAFLLRCLDDLDLLGQAYARGDHDRVRRLRRDEHPSNPQCWLHAPRFCLSCVGVDAPDDSELSGC